MTELAHLPRNLAAGNVGLRGALRLAATCLLASLASSAEAAESPAAAVVPSTRQLAWQRLEVEALVHFGMNTFTGREAGTGRETPETFAPESVDCDQWAAAARAAGARTIIFTAKHHDGFCLWPSRLTGHTVRHSPWRGGEGDLVREVAGACRRAGLGFGVYLSPADFHHQDYGRNSRRYNEYFSGQLRELLTDYGPVSQVFLDGAEPVGRHQAFDWPGFHRVIRELQPEAVISIRGPDVRWVGNENGVARESEWSVIPLPRPPEEHDWTDMMAAELGGREQIAGARHLHWYPAVATVSLRRGWFWHPNSGATVKSLPQLMRIYEQTVGRNCGLQLNIMPDRTGRVPDTDFRRLQEFGDEVRTSFAINHCASANATVVTPEPTGAVPFAQKVSFQQPVPVRQVVLQEDISRGQRVEEVEVVVTQAGGAQRTIPATTIGWKRILRVDADAVRELVVRVKHSRGEPLISVAAY